MSLLHYRIGHVSWLNWRDENDRYELRYRSNNVLQDMIQGEELDRDLALSMIQAMAKPPNRLEIWLSDIYWIYIKWRKIEKENFSWEEIYRHKMDKALWTKIGPHKWRISNNYKSTTWKTWQEEKNKQTL